MIWLAGSGLAIRRAASTRMRITPLLRSPEMSSVRTVCSDEDGSVITTASAASGGPTITRQCPTLIVSPGAIASGARTTWPLRYVRFRLPQSTTCQAPSVHTSRACWREMTGSLASRSRQRWLRPIRSSGSSSSRVARWPCESTHVTCRREESSGGSAERIRDGRDDSRRGIRDREFGWFGWCPRPHNAPPGSKGLRHLTARAETTAGGDGDFGPRALLTRPVRCTPPGVLPAYSRAAGESKAGTWETGGAFC